MRRQLCVENLESRTLLAADVLVLTDGLGARMDTMPAAVDDGAQAWVAAETKGARGNQVARPYKTSISETVVVDLREESQGIDEYGVYFPFTIEGSGQATHLGRFSSSGEGRFYVLVFETGTTEVVGSGTVVAANGDELNWEFVAEDFENLGLGAGIGTWTPGGSGRFANASGSFAFDEWNEVEEQVDGILTIHRTASQSGTLKY
jgi:hypothetical protein